MNLESYIYRTSLAAKIKSLKTNGKNQLAKRFLSLQKRTPNYKTALNEKKSEQIVSTVHQAVIQLLDRLPESRVDHKIQSLQNTILQFIADLDLPQLADENDQQVVYLNELEHYYQLLNSGHTQKDSHIYGFSQGKPEDDKRNLKLSQNIKIYTDFVSIGGIEMQRKNLEHTHNIPDVDGENIRFLNGNYYFSYQSAIQIAGGDAIPSPQHWKEILHATPGNNLREKSIHLAKILDLPLNGYHFNNREACWKANRQGYYWCNKTDGYNTDHSFYLHISKDGAFVESTLENTKGLTVRALYTQK